MKKIEIKIDGKEYPCRQTMGAMLRFKQETGKEVKEIGGNLSDICAYLFCCVASACKKDNVPFLSMGEEKAGAYESSPGSI